MADDKTSSAFDKYSLVNEDEHKFDLQHPDGSTFSIAKGPLDFLTRAHISSLPGPDDAVATDAKTGEPVLYGAQAQPPASQVDTSPAPNFMSPEAQNATGPGTFLNGTGRADQIKNLLSDTKYYPEGSPERASLQKELDTISPAANGQPGGVFGALRNVLGDGSQPQASQGQSTANSDDRIPNAAPTAATPKAPSTTGGGMGGYQAQELKGVQEKADAESDLGKQQSAAYADLVQNLKQADNEFQQKHAEYTARTEKLMNDIATSKINPNEYWENKSTGNKVLAAISIALSGIGSGLAGGHASNMAMDVINKGIERDIDAQKANLSNKNSLLSRNLEMTHDLESATALTRANLTGIASATINKALADNASPMAIANRDIVVGQLKRQYMNDNYELARRSAMSKFLSGMQSSGGQAGTLAPAKTLTGMKMSGLIDDKQYEESNKELAIAQKTQAAHSAADDMANGIATQQTTANRLLNPIQSSQKIKALRAELIPLIMEANPSKRLTKESLEEEIDPLIQKWNTGKQTANEMKAGLHRLIDTHSAGTPTLDGLNLSPKKYQAPPKIKNMNGIPHMQVPGGWQRVQ